MVKKQAFRLALCIVALISSWAAVAQTATIAAQSITIPAQDIIQSLVISGTTVKFTITVPAQVVQIPAQTVAVAIPASAPTLPAGMTFTDGALKVTGPITAASITLFGGSPMPASASGLYLFHLNSGGFLEPVPYPYVAPTTTK